MPSGFPNSTCPAYSTVRPVVLLTMPAKTPKTPQTPSPSTNLNNSSTPVRPKNKTINQVEWKHCTTCDAFILAKDWPKHADSHELLSGYIRQKILRATVEEREDECFSRVPESFKPQLVLVAPATLQLCSIAIGDEITLSSLVTDEDSSDWIGIAWPCSHIHPTSVSKSPTSNWNLRAGAVVSIQKLCPTVPAKALTLELLSTLPPATAIECESFIQSYLTNKVVRKNEILRIKYYGRLLQLKVREIHAVAPPSIVDELSDAFQRDVSFGSAWYRVLPSTLVTIEGLPLRSSTLDEKKRPSIDSIGGYQDVVNELTLLASQVFNAATEKSSRGVLLYGPPGTGKSLMCQALASHLKVNVVCIQGPELYSKYYGETEARIKEQFQLAKQKSPCVLVLDEIDALCPKRQGQHSDQERRVVAAVLALLDDLSTSYGPQVLVLATTNRPDAVDSALRRPGRLDREVELRVPTPDERRTIIEKHLCHRKHQISTEALDLLSKATHGFVGADLMALVEEAALKAASRLKTENDSIAIMDSDLASALTRVSASGMREVQVEVAKVQWTDIGGQEALKLQLKQSVEWPLKNPEAFKRLGIKPPKGLLMFGPPGCSKTMIAKALATETGLNFISVKGPELFSKWVGESERAVRDTFKRARQMAPAVVFLDELDALASSRSNQGHGVGDRVLAQLLTEMDGVEALEDVLVVAATNRPDMIDAALLRPGRLDRLVYVPLPDLQTRKAILALRMSRTPMEDVELDWLAEITEGYSGAELSALVQESALRALEEDIHNKTVTRKHVTQALQVVLPRTSQDLLELYAKYNASRM